MSYQIEILGPTGAVHYRRPIDHQMVRDALTTPGYAVRWPGCRDMRKLDDLPQNCKAEVTFPAEGMTAACPKREQQPCPHCGAVHLRVANVLCERAHGIGLPTVEDKPC